MERLRRIANLGCPHLLTVEDVYHDEGSGAKCVVTRLPRESLRDRM